MLVAPTTFFWKSHVAAHYFNTIIDIDEVDISLLRVVKANDCITYRFVELLC